jgi:hypothetical protein
MSRVETTYNASSSKSFRNELACVFHLITSTKQAYIAGKCVSGICVYFPINNGYENDRENDLYPE